MGSTQLVERGNTVTGLEIEDILSHCLYDTRDVVTMVERLGVGGPIFGLLPVLWVRARDNSPDQDLPRAWCRNTQVANLNNKVLIVKGRLHYEIGGLDCI